MSPSHNCPPGFEDKPLYRNKTTIETIHTPIIELYKPKTPMHLTTKKTNGGRSGNDTYATIKTLCAEKLNIYLPTIGYCHIVLEDENPDNLFELAYKNEFKTKKKPEDSR